MLAGPGPPGPGTLHVRPAGRRDLIRRGAVLLAALALAAAACSGSGDGDDAAAEGADGETTTTPTTAAPPTTLPAPQGDEVYDPPDPLPDGEPGELIWAQSLDHAPAGALAWRVLYHSRDVHDADVAVSGVVIAPDRPAPEGGFPVISWAHGTTGAADRCAPSKAGAAGPPYLERWVGDGYVLASTDYEGLGTPGHHPYLVGESEGRGVLDMARAARRIGEANAGRKVVVWGHSQGGQAALFAGQAAESYAPDLDVVGVVAGAPASELTTLLRGASMFPAFYGFIATAGYAWSETYPEARLDDILTPEGRSKLAVVEEECLGGVSAAFNLPLERIQLRSPLEVDPWPALMERNTPGAVATPAPILIIQGSRDILVPPTTTDVLFGRLCDLDDTVSLKAYEGADHTGVIALSEDEVVDWVRARFADEPAPSTC